MPRAKTDYDLRFPNSLILPSGRPHASLLLPKDQLDYTSLKIRKADLKWLALVASSRKPIYYEGKKLEGGQYKILVASTKQGFRPLVLKFPSAKDRETLGLTEQYLFSYDYKGTQYYRLFFEALDAIASATKNSTYPIEWYITPAQAYARFTGPGYRE